MNSRFWKVYGKEGHRQRESFRASDSFTTLNGNKVEVWNSDKTGTNEYSIVKITAESEKACLEELNAQLSDGVFENSRVERIEEINNDDCSLYAIEAGFGSSELWFYETREEAIEAAREYWNILSKEEKASKDPILEIYEFNNLEAVEKYKNGEYEDFFELADAILTENYFRKEEERGESSEDL